MVGGDSNADGDSDGDGDGGHANAADDDNDDDVQYADAVEAPVFVAGENHAGEVACLPHSRLHTTPWPIPYVRALNDGQSSEGGHRQTC